MKNVLRKLINEPLLHFVLLGVLIFIVYGLVAEKSSDPENIVITRGEIVAMKTGYQSTWGRQATNEELESLIRDRVKQEVYCREAVALGLDKDDLIIQRRLQQKMEFIVNDNLEEAKPGDSVLQDFLAKHPDQFRLTTRFTFMQVFLDAGKRGNSIEKDAAGMLAMLNKGNTDFKKLGDLSLLPLELSNTREIEISGQFGEAFAAQLIKLPEGTWVGPVKSTYGLHLVKVIKRAAPGANALADVREAVTREWENSRRDEANEKFYQQLLRNYKVKIEDQALK